MRLRLTVPSSLGMLFGLLLLGLCGRAQAFQSPARFLDDPVEKGGGGQRFFTGSPADGYTCKVCHTPGEPVHVEIAGFPVDGYVPGRAYPIVLDWADDLKAVGLNAEFTDQSGVALGELTVPDVSQLTPNDLCSVGKQSGAGVFPMRMRAVVVVGECGQHQTTFVWKAPSVPQSGPAWFSGSLVVSDGNGDVIGDRVTDFRRALSVAGTVAPVTTSITQTSNCAVLARGDGADSVMVSALALAAVWLASRRRRHSNARGRES
jgi:hypothetical protein